MMRAIGLLIILGLSFVQSAQAHTRSQSFSNWDVSGSEANFVFAVDVRRVTQLGTLYPETTDLSQLLKIHVSETLGATQSGEPCILKNLTVPTQAQEVLRLRGSFTCAADITEFPIKLTINSFFAVSPTHIHMARTEIGEGQGDYVLKQGASDFILPARAPPNTLGGFIRAGFHHVLSGLDHIVFLMALALVARKPREAVLCVTGFTLGHTAALGLSVFGAMSPNEMLVEAAIGFTIALMALEAGTLRGVSRRSAYAGFAVFTVILCLLPLGAGPYYALAICLGLFTLSSGQMGQILSLRLLPILTLAFGLIHGAGFAGGLQEMSLSQAHIITPLLGFNIGVELAQLLVLGLVYSAVWALSKLYKNLNQPAESLTSTIIFGLGCYWFAQRLWT